MNFFPQGFCLPADMTDEMDGDGATQFEDIEGGGMGEGEGAKDVSDQIETEDQVWKPFFLFPIWCRRIKF